ncbi:MAG TPA: phospholipase D-like domain-containing protein [Candidatus Bathyarchaeia archaeon]|nr:phospholipase D-like domain-containing protein [Candidatus Bathyarchaeia archaeon]
MTRTFRRTLLLFLLIVGVSAAVGAAHYALRGGSVLRGGTVAGLQGSGGALVEAARQRLAEVIPPNPFGRKTGGIRVYFAPSDGAGSDRIDAAFLDFLRSARRSIHGAFYDLQWAEAARVLAEKRGEGVDVALVCDSDYKDREAVKICLRAGIKIVFDGRSALMHDKFCVIDGERVWTGSTNCTENGMFRNNNNSLIVVSDKLAADYAAEFQEMFGQGKFGKSSPRATPYPQLTVEGVDVECYFAPEDDVYQEIEAEIEAARASIDFMAFSFTLRDLAKAMVRRQDDGVRVRGIFDTQQAASRYSQDEYLAEKGATIYLDRNPHVMHHKVIVVDGQTVVTGSYNFSKSAEEKNDENVIIIHSADIAKEYVREFEKLALN